MGRRHIPYVIGDILIPLDAANNPLPGIPVGSSSWYAWLLDEQHYSFSLRHQQGVVTVRRERKRNSFYWYAYHWQGRKPGKTYLGKSEDLNAQRLHDAVVTLTKPGLATPEAVPPTQLHLAFLGTPYVLLNHVPVEMLSGKAIALLAYLAAHEDKVSRERLMALLWPESSQEAARKNLRNILWTLRATLGNALLRGNERLSLHPSIQVDLWTFQHQVQQSLSQKESQEQKSMTISACEEILTLYRGPFLDDILFPDLPEVERWIVGEREHLAQQYMKSLHVLTSLYKEQENWLSVLQVAQRGLAVDPLQETLHQICMESYAYLGARTEALHQYDVLQSLLEQELAVAPLPQTQWLRTAILQGHFHPHQLPLAESISSSKRYKLSSPLQPFIGRRTEQGELDTQLQVTVRGQARVVLLTGEQGIGKSRLWQEWKMRLPADLPALEMQCLEVTRALPFAPLVALFRRASWAPALFSSPRLSAVWRSELARLLPDMRASVAPTPALSTRDSGEERHLLFEACVQCLLTFDASGLVLFLDDVQWLDMTMLEWLGYMIERLSSHPLLLVLAGRTEEMTAPLLSLTSKWRQEGMLKTIPLPRLTNNECTALFLSMGGNSQHQEVVCSQSAGNPYFLSELVQAAPGEVPATLAELVKRRLNALPPRAMQVLQAAAVLDPESTFMTLRLTSGRDEEELLDALDTLLQYHLLIDQQEQYQFSHPLVATVVYRSMQRARRKILHLRAAHALEMTETDRLPALAGRLMRHYSEADHRVRAVQYADMAIEAAFVMAAWDEAVSFSQQALQFEPTPWRYIRLGQACLWQGNHIEAQKAFKSAYTASLQQEQIDEGLLRHTYSLLPPILIKMRVLRLPGRSVA